MENIYISILNVNDMLVVFFIFYCVVFTVMKVQSQNKERERFGKAK